MSFKKYFLPILYSYRRRFFDADFKVQSTNKDNTGRKVYVENMVFPTLSFPSDHGITSTVLVEVPTAAASKHLKGGV